MVHTLVGPFILMFSWSVDVVQSLYTCIINSGVIRTENTNYGPSSACASALHCVLQRNRETTTLHFLKNLFFAFEDHHKMSYPTHSMKGSQANFTLCCHEQKLGKSYLWIFLYFAELCSIMKQKFQHTCENILMMFWRSYKQVFLLVGVSQHCIFRRTCLRRGRVIECARPRD